MNSLFVFVLLGLAASAFASGYGRPYQYQPGFRHVKNGVATPYRNDLRQIAVNNVAEYVGSGTGTARWYGVPGANSGVYYNGPSYGYGRAGYGPYGGYGAPIPYGGPAY